jgi:hypothetical protein
MTRVPFLGRIEKNSKFTLDFLEHLVIQKAFGAKQLGTYLFCIKKNNMKQFKIAGGPYPISQDFRQ